MLRRKRYTVVSSLDANLESLGRGPWNEWHARMFFREFPLLCLQPSMVSNRYADRGRCITRAHGTLDTQRNGGAHESVGHYHPHRYTIQFAISAGQPDGVSHA